MDRLTKKYAGGYGLVKVKDNEQDLESPYPNTLRACFESWQRLAAYEDTGLAPDGIEAMKAELSALKTDIEAGRLVMLPCAVGDSVYIITENFFDCQNCPHKSKAEYNAKFGRVCCDLEDCHCPREVQERFVFGFNVNMNGVSDPGEWGYEGLEPFAGIDGKWYRTEAEALAAMEEGNHES